MSDTFGPAIDRLQKTIAEMEAALIERKKMVNMLCAEDDHEPLYVIESQSSGASLSGVNDDSYYGLDTAAVIEDILVRRKRAGKGAMPVAEIYQAMKDGGFHFTASSDENNKRGVYISLGKNPKFHKLPNGSYGLAAWYPAAKQTKPASKTIAEPDDEPDEAEEMAGVGVDSGEARPKKPR